MDYRRIYNSVVERAKGRKLKIYKEKHHIVPRCMGGSNLPDNIVELTAKEHYLCHRLLHCIYPKNKHLAIAFHTMSVVKSDQQPRYVPSLRAVEAAKIANSIARKGIPKTEESIRKRTETRQRNGSYSRSEESIRKGIETRQKNNTLSYGPFSEEHKKKLSEKKKKPINMYTEGYEYLNTFESASKAAQEVGGTVSSISKAANSPLGVYKNYRWKYVV